MKYQHSYWNCEYNLEISFESSQFKFIPPMFVYHTQLNSTRDGYLDKEEKHCRGKRGKRKETARLSWS